MFDAKKVKDEIIDWLRDYFEGTACHAVIGISGGKDSTVAAALCAEALGADRVYGVLMPMGIQKDFDTALEVAGHLGLRHTVINIKESADALYAAIGAGGLPLTVQAETNTPARLRMAVLYAAAAIINGRVANTCNLSEDWVGYSTKFGDSAGDFALLSHLTVTEVKAVGRELGLPQKFIEKVPEDGLSGKTDEQNLGFSYEILDKYIRQGLCDDPAVKEKIDRLHKEGRHKLLAIPSPAFEKMRPRHFFKPQ
jgi:NAD+ synthase